ncbi:methyltransferase domain-containing protein [Maridesulfovibrio sp.]|uniref:methyltransferase domain-containing protein n=1 Tax=unclassified Maridesulfovibrio TaxID=2794999 RepID=UPI003AFF8E9F
MDSTAPLAPCNICGSSDFGLGPIGRLSNTKRLPVCKKCGALERHRIIRKIFNLIPQELIRGRKAIQFSHDDSLDHSQFATYIVSEYGKQYSLDIQNTFLPDGIFDWVISNHVINFVPDDIAAIKEMARIAGEHGIILLTVGGSNSRYGTTRYNSPTGHHNAYYVYGSDFGDRLKESVPDCSILELVATDPSTGTLDIVYLYSRDWGALRKIATVAAPKNIYARLTPPSKFRNATADAPVWAELERELKLWQDMGRTPKMWIRDDDVSRVRPSLEALWNVCDKHNTPLSLAVIPSKCKEKLRSWVMERPQITVLQHGFDHSNHATENEIENDGKSEFPDSLPSELALKQIRTGRLIIEKQFSARFSPIFVPPWGNCSEEIIQKLPSLGFQGNSSDGLRGSATQHGLQFANTHIGLPTSTGSSWGLHEHEFILKLTKVLGYIRNSETDPDEALGINTHNAGMSDRDLDFLDHLIDFTLKRGVKWININDAAGLV